MAAKKKRKAARTVYRAVKKGGHKRKTSAIRHTNVFRANKHGKRRRVRRINPGFAGIGLALAGAVAGLATGVVVRVAAHMIAPGSDAVQKGLAAAATLGGAALASKFPHIGVGVATGGLDAALQNVATFKAEMMLAPKPTVQGFTQVRPQLGSIQFQNMRGLPAYARMSGVSTLSPNTLGAIQFQNMRGMGSLDFTSRNPFDLPQ